MPAELQQDLQEHPAVTLLVSICGLCFCPARPQNQASMMLRITPILHVAEIQPSCCGQRGCSVACVKAQARLMLSRVLAPLYMSDLQGTCCCAEQRRGMFIQVQGTPNPASNMFVPGRPVLDVSSVILASC